MKMCLLIRVLVSIVLLPYVWNAETTFYAYMKVNGLSLCVMDAASEEVSARSEINCGIKCLARPSCSLFTYRKTTAKCGLYDNQPMSLEAVEGCSSYVLRMTPVSSPSTVLAESGSNVTLDCRRISHNIRWSFTPHGSRVTSVIVENCRLADGYQDRYAVESFGFRCRLLILSTSSGEAGVYECQDNLFPIYAPTTSSVLTTLNFISKCSASNTGVPLYSGQRLTLNNSVTLTGEAYAMTMQWLDSSGKVVLNATSAENSSSLSLSVEQKGSTPEISPFFCSVSILSTLPNDSKAIVRTFNCSSARVPVIGLVPECSDNSNSGAIAMGKYLNVTCVLEFVGNLVPNFTWLDYQRKSIKNASFTVGQNVVSTVLIEATMSLIGTLQFVTWMPDVPGVLYFWNSTNFTVSICPSGFQYLSSGSCYSVLIAGMTWATANTSCAQLSPNSYLASIGDDAEQNVIEDFLAVKLSDSSSDICLYPNDKTMGKFIWIGARVLDLNVLCQSFVWFLSAGATSPLGYTNWMPKQPSCTSSKIEQCVHLWKDSNFMWNDAKCAHNICALCEYDL